MMNEAALYHQHLARIATTCERVAAGDLEARLTDASEDPEIRRAMISVNQVLNQTGAFAREIEALRAAESLRQRQTAELDRTVKTVAQAIEQTSTEIRSTAKSLTDSADRASSDVAQVSAASERTSDGVQGVACATDELAIAFGEIERQATQSVNVTNRAVTGVERINQVIARLNEASAKIGGVIRIISQIARQTNLLALNATIEAARSGDAGRGFAVVASEVKNLAQKTAGATEEIEGEVSAIQKAAAETTSSITAITASIHSVDESARAIVTAVKSQRDATSAIARSVSETTLNMQQVSSSIANVREAAQLTNKSALALQRPADQLSEHAASLARSFDSFLSSANL